MGRASGWWSHTHSGHGRRRHELRAASARGVATRRAVGGKLTKNTPRISATSPATCAAPPSADAAGVDSIPSSQRLHHAS
ncbi:MAG: hypothetical protein ACPIOQ_50460, partial [Promethearchaeia archaeon]